MPSIASIRETIEAAIWNARDLDGATREEFARMDVPARLTPNRAALEALSIADRFTRDRERRTYAVELIDRQITKWRTANGKDLRALPVQTPTIQ